MRGWKMAFCRHLPPTTPSSTHLPVYHFHAPRTHLSPHALAVTLAAKHDGIMRHGGRQGRRARLRAGGRQLIWKGIRHKQLLASGKRTRMRPLCRMGGRPCLLLAYSTIYYVTRIFCSWRPGGGSSLVARACCGIFVSPRSRHPRRLLSPARARWARATRASRLRASTALRERSRFAFLSCWQLSVGGGQKTGGRRRQGARQAGGASNVLPQHCFLPLPICYHSSQTAPLHCAGAPQKNMTHAPPHRNAARRTRAGKALCTTCTASQHTRQTDDM